MPPQGGLGAHTGLGLQENQDRFHWICLERGAPPQDDALRGPRWVPPLTVVISKVFNVRMNRLLLCDATKLTSRINRCIVVLP